jgi:hypothetical protein
MALNLPARRSRPFGPDRDSRVRAAALAEGDKALATNEVGHNHILFRRDAIEAYLETGDWDGALRQANALEEFTRPEPLPWTELIVGRGRALAKIGQDGRAEDLVLELGLSSRMQKLSVTWSGCHGWQALSRS